jgi:opacity protein-like surface antigen
MKTISTSLFAAACVAAASAAHALPWTDSTRSGEDKLSLELFAGGNVGMPGSFRGQTVPFDTSGPSGALTYKDLKFDDAYAHRVSGGAELAYAMDEHLSTFARATYNEFSGDHVNIGQFQPAAPGTDPHVVGAQFGDTATREFDLGARYTFTPWGRVSPFAGAALGATHLSATKAAIDNPSGFGTTRVDLGKAETVFSQRAELGLQYAPIRNFDLRLTAAADHVDADRRSDDPNLALVGLDNVRGEMRGHWDYPVELGGVWRF